MGVGRGPKGAATTWRAGAGSDIHGSCGGVKAGRGRGVRQTERYLDRWPEKKGKEKEKKLPRLDSCSLNQREIGADSSSGFQRFPAKPSHGACWMGQGGSHYQYAATVDLAWCFAPQRARVHFLGNGQSGQRRSPAQEFKML